MKSLGFGSFRSAWVRIVVSSLACAVTAVGSYVQKFATLLNLNATKSALSLSVLVFALIFMPSSARATVIRDCPQEPKQGVPIVSGDTYFGPHCVLSTASDVDSFQFKAVAGDTWSVILAFGSSPTVDICVKVYAPGSPPPLVLSGCTLAHNGQYETGATALKITSSGVYTIDLYELSTAVQPYGLSLERVSPLPPDDVALTLGQSVAGGINAPTSMNAFSFYAGTSGNYAITGSVPSGSAYNVCFQIYQPGGTPALNTGPWCTFVHNFVFSIQATLAPPPQNGMYMIEVYAGPRADELIQPFYGTVNYNLSVVCLTVCPNPPPTPCTIKDAPHYDATSGTLTMNFTLATPVAATWNAWLTTGNSIQSLWSTSEPITEPPVTITKTHSLAKSGKVGVLSTFTTPTGGINCSNWVTINTGTP